MSDTEPITGPENYLRARVELMNAEASEDDEERRYFLASAQVHATLALVAATVHTGTARHDRGWQRALGET